ncbi:MAG TPA: GNAT family N-acetyltransferase [Burkholderiales bacterium]|nr:GNAT family N-acetyltransferase [Burkholderiales bacterium]
MTSKLGDWTLELRPIRADDEALWLTLMKEMSWATRYKRGARRVEDLRPQDVRQAVAPDPVSEMALVALATRAGEARMVGVARAVQRDGTWEFALVVLDEWQRRGVGRRLMHALLRALQERSARCVEGDVLASNRNMLDFVQRLGFRIAPHPESRSLKRVTRDIAPPGSAP